MGTRPRHKGKETEGIIAEAERRGWRVIYPKGHWGYLYCEHGDCSIRISGTPQNDGSHARRIARQIAQCANLSIDGENDGDV